MKSVHALFRRSSFLVALAVGLGGCSGAEEGRASDDVVATPLAPPPRARTSILIGDPGGKVLDRWAPTSAERALPSPGAEPLAYRFEPADGSEAVEGVVADPRVLHVEGDLRGEEAEDAGDDGHAGEHLEARARRGVVTIETVNAKGTLVVRALDGDELARVGVEAVPATIAQPAAFAGPEDFVGEPVTLVDHSAFPLARNVLIVPDGYTEAELPKFREEADLLVARLAQLPGYKENWNAFNVYRQDVRSRESGVAEPGQTKDTAFELSFGDGTNRPRRCVIWDNTKTAVMSGLLAVKRRVNADVLVILANSTEWGGCARFAEQTFAMTRSGSDAARAGMMAHEMGHALFKLNDEYAYDTCDLGRWASGGVNVSSNLGALPWADLLTTTELPTPSTAGDDVIGAFEGAGYCPTGAYRAQKNCMMRESLQPFCAVCQRQIRRTFDALGFAGDAEGGRFADVDAQETFEAEGELAASSNGPVLVSLPMLETPWMAGVPMRITVEGLAGKPFVNASAVGVDGLRCFAGTDGYCDLALFRPTKLVLSVEKYGAQAARYRVRVAPVATSPWPGLETPGWTPANGEERFETPVVPAGKYVFALTTGTADTDLFVRAGTAPTPTAFDCKSDGPIATEVCSLTITTAQALHVLVRNASPVGAGFTLRMRPDGAPWRGLSESGVLAAQKSRPYLVPALPAGRYRFTITGGTGDPDLYVRVGQPPTYTAHACKSDGPTASERCEIALTATSNVYVHVKNAANATGTYELEGIRLP